MGDQRESEGGVSDEVPLRKIMHDDHRYAEIAQLSEFFRAATSSYVSDAADPRQAMSVLMTAAAVFAGIQFGMIRMMGELRMSDQKHAEKAMVHNFRTGIGIGVRKAARSLKESAEGTA